MDDPILEPTASSSTAPAVAAAASKPDPRRRRFLLSLGAGSAGAAAAMVCACPIGARQPAPEEATAKTSGYRETAHVRNYYRSAKV